MKEACPYISRISQEPGAPSSSAQDKCGALQKC